MGEKYRKRTLKPDLLREVERVLEMRPRDVMENHYRFLELIRPIIRTKSDLLISQMIGEIGLTHNQFYQRVKNPDLWKKSELEAVLKIIEG